MTYHTVTDRKKAFLENTNTCIKNSLYKDARDLSVQYLTRFPQDMDAILMLCQSLMGLKKLDQAEEILKEIEQQIYAHCMCFLYLGDICQQHNKETEAVEYYKKYIHMYPESPLTKDIINKIEIASANTGDAGLPASTAFQDMEESDSGLHTITLADIYVSQGHIDMAIDVLEKIIAQNPESDQATRRLNELRLDIKRNNMKLKSLSELTRWLINVQRLKNQELVH